MAASKFTNSILVSMVLIVCSGAMTLHNGSAQEATDNRSIAVPHSNLNPNFTASIPLASSLFEVFNSKIDVSLGDVISNATSFIGPNTIVLSGSVGTESGFLVYRIAALDSNNNIHMILVDPGNGKVLSQRQWPAAMSKALSEIPGIDPQLEGFPGVRVMP